MSSVVYDREKLPVLGVAQSRMFHSTARYLVAVAARRLGKTTYAGVRLFHKAYVKPEAEVRYIAPTYKMAKMVFWEPLKRMIPRRYVWKKNESDLSITLLNSSRIMLLGMEDPDSQRGPGLDDAVFDEYADIPPEAWEEVIRPALADKEGTAAFLGTPKGYNHFYDLYLKGLPGHEDFGEWASFSFTTAQGGRVKKTEIEKAKRDLDIRVFRQEFEASFETLSGRVYDNFVRATWPKGNIDPHIIDLGGQLVVGMDFNINPMTAVIMQECRGWPQVLDEIELPTSNTEEMAQALKRKYPGRTIVVCPDASGDSRHTSSPMGQTDFTILQSHGFRIEAGRANPMVVDRINNTQSLLCGGTGMRRVTIHPRNKALIKALEGLTWKLDTSGRSTNLVNKSQGLDHIADAFGYPLWQRWNLLGNIIPAAAPITSGLYSPWASELGDG